MGKIQMVPAGLYHPLASAREEGLGGQLFGYGAVRPHDFGFDP